MLQKKIHEQKISLNDSLFVFSAKLRTSLSLSIYTHVRLDLWVGRGGREETLQLF